MRAQITNSKTSMSAMACFRQLRKHVVRLGSESCADTGVTDSPKHGTTAVMVYAGWGRLGLTFSCRMILAFTSFPSGHLTNKSLPSTRAGIPTFLPRPEIFSSRFKGGSYTAVYSVPSSIRETSRITGGGGVWGLKLPLPANNANNVYIVGKGRINIEEYRASRVFGDLANAFNFGPREKSGREPKIGSFG